MLSNSVMLMLIYLITYVSNTKGFLPCRGLKGYIIKQALAKYGSVSYTHLTLPTNREV